MRLVTAEIRLPTLAEYSPLQETILKRLRRSMIIIPGNVPEYLEKCRRLEADALIIDIQDAIAKVDAAKLQAREMVVNAIKAGGFRAREVYVRV